VNILGKNGMVNETLLGFSSFILLLAAVNKNLWLLLIGILAAGLYFTRVKKVKKK
jgi:hypothetical protein